MPFNLPTTSFKWPTNPISAFTPLSRKNEEAPVATEDRRETAQDTRPTKTTPSNMMSSVRSRTNGILHQCRQHWVLVLLFLAALINMSIASYAVSAESSKSGSTSFAMCLAWLIVSLGVLIFLIFVSVAVRISERHHTRNKQKVVEQGGQDSRPSTSGHTTSPDTGDGPSKQHINIAQNCLPSLQNTTLTIDSQAVQPNNRPNLTWWPKAAAASWLERSASEPVVPTQESNKDAPKIPASAYMPKRRSLSHDAVGLTFHDSDHAARRARKNTANASGTDLRQPSASSEKKQTVSGADDQNQDDDMISVIYNPNAPPHTPVTPSSTNAQSYSPSPQPSTQTQTSLSVQLAMPSPPSSSYTMTNTPSRLWSQLPGSSPPPSASSNRTFTNTSTVLHPLAEEPESCSLNASPLTANPSSSLSVDKAIGIATSTYTPQKLSNSPPKSSPPDTIMNYTLEQTRRATPKLQEVGIKHRSRAASLVTSPTGSSFGAVVSPDTTTPATASTSRNVSGRSRYSRKGLSAGFGLGANNPWVGGGGLYYEEEEDDEDNDGQQEDVQASSGMEILDEDQSTSAKRGGEDLHPVMAETTAHSHLVSERDDGDGKTEVIPDVPLPSNTALGKGNLRRLRDMNKSLDTTTASTTAAQDSSAAQETRTAVEHPTRSTDTDTATQPAQHEDISSTRGSAEGELVIGFVTGAQIGKRGTCAGGFF